MQKKQNRIQTQVSRVETWKQCPEGWKRNSSISQLLKQSQTKLQSKPAKEFIIYIESEWILMLKK